MILEDFPVCEVLLRTYLSCVQGDGHPVPQSSTRGVLRGLQQSWDPNSFSYPECKTWVY